MKKAQTELGTILLVFIAILIGLILILPIAQIVGDASTIYYHNNSTYTAPALNAIIDLDGQELSGTPVVYNATDNVVYTAANYTIDEGVSTSTGVKTIRFTSLTNNISSYPLLISYSYGKDGYIDNAGGRSMASLIVIFAALAVGMVSLYLVLKSGVLQQITGK